MGCDGIWETKTSQQIVDYIYVQMQRKVKLSKIAEGLLDTLLSPNVNRTEGKGCDNMSVILIDFRQWAVIWYYKTIFTLLEFTDYH